MTAIGEPSTHWTLTLFLSYLSDYALYPLPLQNYFLQMRRYMTFESCEVLYLMDLTSQALAGHQSTQGKDSAQSESALDHHLGSEGGLLGLVHFPWWTYQTELENRDMKGYSGVYSYINCEDGWKGGIFY